VEGTVALTQLVGPASWLLAKQPEMAHTAAANFIRDTVTPYAKGDAVPMGGSIWIVTARTPCASQHETMPYLRGAVGIPPRSRRRGLIERNKHDGPRAEMVRGLLLCVPLGENGLHCAVTKQLNLRFRYLAEQRRVGKGRDTNYFPSG
jgi:hypothetical protein